MPEIPTHVIIGWIVIGCSVVAFFAFAYLVAVGLIGAWLGNSVPF